jgi:hypothetical protein
MFSTTGTVRWGTKGLDCTFGNTEGRVAVDEVTIVTPVGVVICVVSGLKKGW